MFSKINQMQQQSPQTTPMKRAREEDVVEDQPSSKRESAARLYMPHEFDETDVTIVLDADKKIPKVVLKGNEKSKYPLLLNTPVVSVQFSKLGEKGNSGEFGKTDEDFDFEIKTIVDLEDRVVKAMPNEPARGKAFFEFVRNTTDKLLEFAYNTKGCMDSHTKKADKAAKKKGTTGLEIFKANALVSQFKDYEYKQTGEEVEMFQCKRHGTYQGIPQRPVFWKSTKDGYKVKEDVKYLTYKTAVKHQFGFKVWENPSKYGVSCTLGKNIIVVYENKQSTNTGGPSQSAAPMVPYDI